MWFMRTVAVLHSTMRDSEVVAAIVAGDPEGLAEAYDRYASPLYTYCRSLLREPADAADAVQDTFVIAASRLAGLRDRNRLRPWLYAVARNECHRRLRARTVQVTTPLDEMPDVTDTSADVSGEAERDELRTLLRSAVRGLNSGERDLIELQLQQGLDVAEIAAVLGVSRNHDPRAAVPGPRSAGDLSRRAARGPVGAARLRGPEHDARGLGRPAERPDAQADQPSHRELPGVHRAEEARAGPGAAARAGPAGRAAGRRTARAAGAGPQAGQQQHPRRGCPPGQRGAAHRAVRAARVPQAAGPAEVVVVADPVRSGRGGGRRGGGGRGGHAAGRGAGGLRAGPSGRGRGALGPGSGPGTSIAAAGGTPGGPGSGGSSNRPQPTVSANGAANVSPGAGGAPPPGGGGSAPPSGGSATSPGSPGHSGHPSPPASAPPSSSSAKPSSPAPAPAAPRRPPVRRRAGAS